MCCFERPAVVAAVPAHDDLAAQLLEALYQLYLLLGQHPGHKCVTVIFTILRVGALPGEDLPAVHNPFEEFWVSTPDVTEGVAVAGEDVVVGGHVLDLAGGRHEDARSLGLGEAVGDCQLTPSSLLRLHPDDGLVRLYKLAISPHAKNIFIEQIFLFLIHILFNIYFY